MSNELMVEVDTLRSQVREKYRDFAMDPHGAATSTPAAP